MQVKSVINLNIAADEGLTATIKMVQARAIVLMWKPAFLAFLDSGKEY